MKHHKVLFYVFLSLTIIVNALIIVESFIGGDDSAAQSFSFSEAVANFIENIDPTTTIITDRGTFHAIFRKVVGHFLLFGLSGLFASLAILFNDFLVKKLKWKNILIITGFGLLVALISELIQFFTPGRAGVLSDVLIDYAGYILFSGLTYLIIYLVRRKALQNQESI